jgi:antitoxin CcdA
MVMANASMQQSLPAVVELKPPASEQVENPPNVMRVRTNVSRVSERGACDEVQAVEARQWAERNTDLVSAYTAIVEREGLPLAKYRSF